MHRRYEGGRGRLPWGPRALTRSVCVLAVVMGGLVLASTAAAVSFTNATPIVIPDGPGAATPYPSPITATGVSGNVTHVTVRLNGFAHTYPDDVDILLVGPDKRADVSDVRCRRHQPRRVRCDVHVRRWCSWGLPRCRESADRHLPARELRGHHRPVPGSGARAVRKHASVGVQRHGSERRVEPLRF